MVGGSIGCDGQRTGVGGVDRLAVEWRSLHQLALAGPYFELGDGEGLACAVGECDVEVGLLGFVGGIAHH